MGPFPRWPNSMAEINGGDPITTYPSPGMILQVAHASSVILFLLASGSFKKVGGLGGLSAKIRVSMTSWWFASNPFKKMCQTW